MPSDNGCLTLAGLNKCHSVDPKINVINLICASLREALLSNVSMFSFISHLLTDTEVSSTGHDLVHVNNAVILKASHTFRNAMTVGQVHC